MDQHLEGPSHAFGVDQAFYGGGGLEPRPLVFALLDGAGHVLEFLEELAVHPHAFEPNLLLVVACDGIGLKCLEALEGPYRRLDARRKRLGTDLRQPKFFVIIEFFLEIFAIGEEIEQAELGLLDPCDLRFAGGSVCICKISTKKVSLHMP